MRAAVWSVFVNGGAGVHMAFWWVTMLRVQGGRRCFGWRVFSGERREFGVGPFVG